MTVAQLDFYFPFIIFFYGFLILLVIENPKLATSGEKHLGFWWAQLQKRKSLAWVSFFAGGLWSMQNVLLTP